jgi:PAS domain S-box-containing protein
VQAVVNCILLWTVGRGLWTASEYLHFAEAEKSGKTATLVGYEKRPLMNFFRALRNFLVGNDRIESRIAYKSALLRGYMAFLAICIGLAYIAIGYFTHTHYNYVYYVAVIVMGVVSIALNRARRYVLSTVLFLFTINVIIFFSSTNDLYRTGSYMFFICISLSAFSLFGFRQIRYAFLFSILSLVLFLVSYTGKVSLIHPPHLSEAYITINFTTNFLVALITSVMIVYFLLNINHHSEAELIRATRELELSRERNEMVIEAVNAGIYELHSLEEVVFISPTWKRLLGYAEHELTNFSLDSYFDILHPDDHELVREHMEQHYRDHKPYFHEVRLRTKSGAYLWVMDSANTKFDADGEPVVTVGSIIDIHERKLAEEKILRQNELLAKANTELDQFVYSVSHDLRAPLSSILGLTNVYRLTDQASEKESIVRFIRERANNLDGFIREILDYSRNSRTTLRCQPVNLLQLVDEVLNGLNYMHGFDSIDMRFEIHPELLVLTDRERVKVILNNLVSNAVKYSDASKKSFVSLQASADKHGFVIQVRDNGIGIREEFHQQIFEMFFQAHDHARGSGLGLYIVKETVQKLQGSISLQSEYGVGTAFTILLPQGEVPER